MTIADIDSVLCILKDSAILQSLWRIAPSWQFRIKELLSEHKCTFLLTYERAYLFIYLLTYHHAIKDLQDLYAEAWPWSLTVYSISKLWHGDVCIKCLQIGSGGISKVLCLCSSN